MPSNTDNSGSARAARLRQISAARGPIPVIRPNIGSMALDAILGRDPRCCPSTVVPVEPTLILVSCGIGPQTLNPLFTYIFGNNTPDSFILRVTDSSGGIVEGILYPLEGTGPITNLVSWETDISGCADPQLIGVFDLNGSIPICFTQVLDPSANYFFEVLFESPPVSIILHDASSMDTPLTLTDMSAVGPYTNLISWRPAGCPLPL